MGKLETHEAAEAVGDGRVRARHPETDTLFRAASGGKYDVIMAMYHDQALIPIKTVAFDQSVNVTIGLA